MGLMDVPGVPVIPIDPGLIREEEPSRILACWPLATGCMWNRYEISDVVRVCLIVLECC